MVGRSEWNRRLSGGTAPRISSERATLRIFLPRRLPVFFRICRFCYLLLTGVNCKSFCSSFNISKSRIRQWRCRSGGRYGDERCFLVGVTNDVLCSVYWWAYAGHLRKALLCTMTYVDNMCRICYIDITTNDFSKRFPWTQISLCKKNAQIDMNKLF